MNIHLMPNEKKFISSFIKMCEEDLPTFQNLYFISSNEKNQIGKKISSSKVIYEDDIGSLRFYQRIVESLESNNVFIHGMFDIKYILILNIFRKKNFRLHWLIWGGDLYSIDKTKGPKSIIRSILKKFLIARVDSVVSKVRGDYLKSKKYLKDSAIFNECLMYTSNTFDQNQKISFSSATKSYIVIQLGNSADKENNHETALNLLKAKSSKQGIAFKIYCPLTYGDMLYAQKVISTGRELFGEHFVPVTDHMPIDEYVTFLSTIDIAVFPHKRQQAMGNIINLLGLGKKVYLSKDVTTFQLFIDYGVDVSDLDEFNFEMPSKDSSVNNMEIIKNFFTYSELVKDWDKIFTKYDENSI